jgi:hypothetical protein
MTREGPPLEALTRRLAECPPEFLLEPRIGPGGTIDAGAVVSDLSRALGGPLLGAAELARFRPADPAERNRLRITLVAAWLLHDEWFRAEGSLAPAAVRFLEGWLDELAPLVDAPLFVSDADRREELARLCLRALELLPAGESEARALDRLTTLSSAERTRVIRETRAAQERVRKIREAMEKKAAQEAAAAYGRE